MSVSGDIAATPSLGDSPRFLPGGRRDWAAALLIVAAVSLVFGRILRQSFLTWDDDLHVTANPWFNPLTIAGVLRFWQAPYEDLYIPVSYSVLAAELWLTEILTSPANGEPYGPVVFKATCLMLHAANSLLVWRLLRTLCRQQISALFGSLLFAVHPLQVESVAWISETRGLLAACFTLLALALRIRYVSRAADPVLLENRVRQTRRVVVASSVCLALGLLSKPSAASAVPIAFVIETVLLRRHWRQVVIGLSPWILLVVLAVVITKLQQSGDRLALDAPWGDRLGVAGDALGFYLRQVLWPAQLAIDYGRSPDAALRGPWWVMAAIPVGVALALWLIRAPRNMWGAFALFIAGSLPTLGLIPFGFQEISTVADRYVYLAMIGPALAFASLAQIGAVRATRFALAGLLIACGMVAYRQVAVWRDSETLYRHTLAINPESSISLNNLGDLLARRGEFDQATVLFRRAIDSRPRSARAWHNLAVCAEHRGDWKEALALHQHAVELQPGDLRCRTSLARLSVRLDRPAEAEEHYRAAVQIAPAQAELWDEYGSVLSSLGHPVQAIAAFRRAVQLQPDEWRARVNLGHMLLQQDHDWEAAAQYRRALGINPDVRDARLNLGLILARRGNLEEGVQQLEAAHALAVTAGDDQLEAAAVSELVVIHNAVGVSAVERGQWDDARRAFDEALELDPSFAAAHFNLARLLSQLGELESAIEHLDAALAQVEPGSAEEGDINEIRGQILGRLRAGESTQTPGCRP